jgi:alpha-glucosidase
MGDASQYPAIETDRAQAQEWWRGATIYQIYPRSFKDSNDDGIGDLAGIMDKLPYVKNLGVDAIWLSPFFRSPMKDFGYDVSDYRAVDPIFGTLADVDQLLARAHELGLKVIIDQVWSHSSDQHAWFEKSAANREGPYADWYVWADAKPDGSAPNNWQSVFGGPSWTWHPRRRQYYLHNFLPSQPDLNFWNPAVRAEILDTARFWLDRGVDGFRLDVINLIYHDHLLRDNPSLSHTHAPAMPSLFQRHLFDRTRPECLSFVEDLRALMDGYEGRMTVGEIFDEDPLTAQRAYVEGKNRLHTAYSFFLLDARGLTPQLFAQAQTAWADASGWPSWSLGNHDVVRFASRMGLNEDPAHIKLALATLLAMRGTIFLYQGEELGLPQANVPRDRLRDPFAIASYTGNAFRDGARTPMPWNGDLVQAGFSTAAQTWLPLDPVHRTLCAHGQAGDPDSVLSFTRRLISVRQANPALQRGGVRLLQADEAGVVWLREHEGQAIACMFNVSAEGPLDVTLPNPPAHTLISQGEVTVTQAKVRLGPSAFAYLQLA